jgi:fused signal recognition particle receptor
MFNLLKNKLTNFVDAIAKKVTGDEKKEEPKEKMQEAKPELVKEIAKEAKMQSVLVAKPVQAQPVSKSQPIPKIQSEKPSETAERAVDKQLEVKPTLLTKLKGLVMPEVMIKEADVKNVIDDLEMQLLEADVAMPVAEFIREDLRSKIIGKNVKYSDLDKFVKEGITQVLFDLLRQDNFDIVGFVNQRKKPVKILFIGPNGHGKTTTIAKFAHMLKKNGFSCVISASDTFRAAAIEQTVEHAARLGVTVIKHQYGADPAAVAFDAIKHAEAKGIDVVLIDTAGRQETDRNLIEQLKKISRVVNPDLKLFVVEGIVGNAVMGQVSQFNAAIPLDGVVLTKVDCDAKGGTVISIKKATGVPVLYLGMGQGYDDLVPFSSDFIISKLMT